MLMEYEVFDGEGHLAAITCQEKTAYELAEVFGGFYLDRDGVKWEPKRIAQA